MKKSTSIVLLALAFAFAAGTAEARTSKKTGSSAAAPVATESLETHQAASEHRGSNATFALGLTSIALTGNGSMTGIIQLTNMDAIQVLAGIGGTTGGFTFNVGGLYKRTLWGSEASGFHVGGGIDIGTVAGNFAMGLSVIGGVHYTLSGTAVSFHLDAGPTLTIANAAPTAAAALAGATSSTQTNFTMQPLSNLLGASVIYAL